MYTRMLPLLLSNPKPFRKCPIHKLPVEVLTSGEVVLLLGRSWELLEVWGPSGLLLTSTVREVSGLREDFWGSLVGKFWEVK